MEETDYVSFKYMKLALNSHTLRLGGTDFNKAEPKLSEILMAPITTTNVFDT